MSSQLSVVLVEIFEAASASALQTAVNAWLATANPAFRLVHTELRYADGATDPYLAMVTYTGV